MILQLEKNANKNEISLFAKQHKLEATEVVTQFGRYIILIGDVYPDPRKFVCLEGIKDIHRVSDDYKLVSKKWKIHNTVLDLGDGVKIGDGSVALMVGPCSIEGEQNILDTVEHLKKNDLRIMRGGVFKPRSSPYSFRGLGVEGLKIFYKHCKENGIKIITEVMHSSQIEPMMDYVDVFQVGARNSQNFNLLDALGEIDKPVMIKRGMSGTIMELLQSAEYVFSKGNERIALCERGIRTYEKAYRNTFDINAVSILKEKSHLPVIADPSHGVGIRKHVANVAKSAVVAGADGVILEVHNQPERAFSDGQQSLSFAEAEELYEQLILLNKILN